MRTSGDLTRFNTLGLNATANHLVTVSTLIELDKALHEAVVSEPIEVLGGRQQRGIAARDRGDATSRGNKRA